MKIFNIKISQVRQITSPVLRTRGPFAHVLREPITDRCMVNSTPATLHIDAFCECSYNWAEVGIQHSVAKRCEYSSESTSYGALPVPSGEPLLVGCCRISDRHRILTAFHGDYMRCAEYIPPCRISVHYH